MELQTEKLPDDRPETLREAIDRAIEVIRNRIDQFGLSEPLIVRQGEKWIVVQLPGVKDQDQAKDLIGRTALLEFRIVESGGVPEALLTKARELTLGAKELCPGKMPESLKELIPVGTELLSGKESSYYLVKSTAEMTGSALKNARVEMGSDYSGVAPHAALEFGPEGAKQFAAVTEANVNRNLAIVLDGVVDERSRYSHSHSGWLMPSSRANLRRKTRNFLIGSSGGRPPRAAGDRRRANRRRHVGRRLDSRGFDGRRDWTSSHFCFHGGLL